MKSVTRVMSRLKVVPVVMLGVTVGLVLLSHVIKGLAS
jgi:hypothetical protein